MSTDLEFQLRLIGDALDQSSKAVDVSEVVARQTDLEASPSDLAELRVVDIDDRRRPFLLSVAASILIIGMIGGFLLLKRARTDQPVATVPPVSTAQPASTAPQTTTSPTSTSAPPPAAEPIPTVIAHVIPLATSLPRPDVFPALPVGDDRKVKSSNYSQVAAEGPEWIAALVARVNGDRIEDGIRIETVREGTSETDPGGSPTETVVLPNDPHVSITGLDPATFLEEAGADFATADWSGDVGKLVIDSQMLPDGYEVIVEPSPILLAGSLRVGMAVKHGGGDGVGISVKLDNPLLFLATNGELERIDVNGVAAWQAPPGIVTWRVSNTTWVSVVRNTEPEVALQVARDLEFVDEATWRQRYGVAEPGSFDGQRDRVGIDRGRADGLAAGMPVVNAAGLVGKLAAVTEATSEVMLLSDIQFAVAAAIEAAGSSSGDGGPTCSVVGRNDHIAFICDSPFGPDVVVGAVIETAAGDSDLPAGVTIGMITDVFENVDGEPIAVIEPPLAVIQPRQYLVAGDELTVLLYRSAGAVNEPDTGTFCGQFASLSGERPEPYVGSAEHVADVDRLIAVAPEPIVGDLTVYRDFLSSGAVDSENDPDSNLVENWPSEVQAAISVVQSLGSEECSG